MSKWLYTQSKMGPFGHKTTDPDCYTYAGVISRESIRTALKFAALTDIDVFTADIRYAYLQAPSSKRTILPVALSLALNMLARKFLSDKPCMVIKVLAETSEITFDPVCDT